MNELQQCHTCRWGWGFEHEEDDIADSYGECHRHAPRPVANNNDEPQYIFVWPLVHGSTGCADWTSRFV